MSTSLSFILAGVTALALTATSSAQDSSLSGSNIEAASGLGGGGFGGRSEPVETFKRVSFPGGTLGAYVDTLLQAAEAAHRENLDPDAPLPFNVLFNNKATEELEVGEISLILPESRLLDVGLAAISLGGVRYEAGPGIYAALDVQALNEWTIRIAAKYWRALDDRPDYVDSIEELVAREEMRAAAEIRSRARRAADDDSIGIAVFPVLHSDLLAAADAIGAGLEFGDFDHFEIMVHEPTGTIVVRGSAEVQMFTRSLLEAIDAGSLHRVESEEVRTRMEDEILERGRSEGREAEIEMMERIEGLIERNRQVQDHHAAERLTLIANIQELREELERRENEISRAEAEIERLRAELEQD